MKQSRDYMKKLVESLQQHFQTVWANEGTIKKSLYYGQQGCKRLAREFGAGLADSPASERDQAIQESYQELCVKGYSLKPPIDAATWIYHVKGGLARGLGA